MGGFGWHVLRFAGDPYQKTCFFSQQKAPVCTKKTFPSLALALAFALAVIVPTATPRSKRYGRQTPWPTNAVLEEMRSADLVADCSAVLEEWLGAQAR